MLSSQKSYSVGILSTQRERESDVKLYAQHQTTSI